MSILFAGMSRFVMLLDLSYADSVFIAPLQHAISIIAGLVAIIVGAPVAYKHCQSVIQFFINIIKKQ